MNFPVKLDIFSLGLTFLRLIILLEEIMELIPHRKPFLFIDTCEIIKLGEEGIGNRNFLEDEYFF